jgi:hypothetical protein
MRLICRALWLGRLSVRRPIRLHHHLSLLGNRVGPFQQPFPEAPRAL